MGIEMPDNYEPGALRLDGTIEIVTATTPDGRKWPANIAHIRPSTVEWRRQSNARRLVACWNACQGLDTGDLENGSVNVMEHLKATPDQRLQKRAEILTEILQGLAGHDFGRVASKTIAAYQAYDAICARARAVLAKP
jgi:hypothetical protein